MNSLLLSPEKTEYYAQKILMPTGATELLVDIAIRLNSDAKLLTIYNNFYESYINSGYWMTVWEPLSIDPYVEELFGEHASLFYLHAALQKLPEAEKKYAQLGLSEDFFVETMRDISTWVQNAFNLVGYYCIRNFSWIWRHLEVKMFRIGRMQYIPLPFTGEVTGYYNKRDKQFILLANAGMELRANGDMQGVCQKEKTSDGFVTTYEETEESYIGHPITAIGKGLKEPVRLSKQIWEKVLEQGDIMLDIHIPRDQPFTTEAVQQSYKDAKAFFKKHFPEVSFKGMMCQSWLFTPQLREMLPASSNLVKFQEQFYLYPTAGSIRSIWFFVFNELMEVKDAKPDTTLRRKILEYIEEDKEIFDMRAVFMDICGEFGEVTYISPESLLGLDHNID